MLVWRRAGLDFVFHMFFLVKYAKSLEEESFRGRSADFLWMLLFGAPFSLAGQHLLGSAGRCRRRAACRERACCLAHPLGEPLLVRWLHG